MKNIDLAKPEDDREIELGHFTEEDFRSLRWRTKRIEKTPPYQEHRRHRVIIKAYEFEGVPFGAA